VITDIAFDHALYLHWATLVELPFAPFKQVVYGRLLAASDQLPERVQQPLVQMVTHDWLEQYVSPLGMQAVFRRLRRRLSRPELLDGIEVSLDEHAAAINHAFRQLFPRLQNLSAAYLDQPSPDRPPP
jgi:acyl carrier protein phosphodiesterase